MTDKNLTGIAGVHFVVSELSRRRIVALPTVKNTAAYDIVAVNPEGTRHANIQVKTSSKRVNFFPMPAPEKIRAGNHDIYILLRWIKQKGTYEVFLLTGRQARDAVRKTVDGQRERIQMGLRNREFPALHVGPPNVELSKKWMDAWQNWTL
ncbi:MAG: hypothetical protein ACNA71_10435 [Kiritimatiellia bacterium]